MTDNISTKWLENMTFKRNNPAELDLTMNISPEDGETEMDTGLSH